MSLPDAFSRLSFAQPARARADLELLRARLPERALALLPTVLAQAPDADGALNNLERFTRELPVRVRDALTRQPALLHYLLALFSHSRFLSETLIQQPELILWLGREKHLERLPSKEELLEEYARFETAALDLEPSLALVRFKRRQYLRITLRDILGLAPLVETTLELSTLADVLLEKALARAEGELRQRYGAPQTTDARGRRVPARFAVVSLGKLGGNELNYSSDVDFLFLYEGEGETSGPAQRLANNEYFQRLAQRLLQIIAGITREGAVFRVDLRLRPGGREGDLAISLPAAVSYYQQRGREWELQMLLKARHSAGEAGLVRAFLAAVEPFLYRGAMHFAAVESVLQSREQFDRQLDARGDRLNVKLAAGGIRDIEFLVQCLQRLHGRQDPWVRAAGTLVGLQKLFDKGYLSGRDHQQLAAAYQFLRLVEHRLQLDLGQQTHTLPESEASVGLLARRCGVAGRSGRSSAEEFRRLLENHLRQVQTIYERTLPGAGRAAEAEEFTLRAPEVAALTGELPHAEILRRLKAQGSPLAHAVDALDIPERARRPFHHFLAAALGSSTIFEQVARAAAALPLAVEVLRLSEPLGGLLLRQPERLALLFELEEGTTSEETTPLALCNNVTARTGLPGALAGLVERRDSFGEQMADLRRYFADAVFCWGAREVCRRPRLETGLCTCTVLTEDILRAGLVIAGQHSNEAAAAKLAVVALGRLGTAEMDLASDADLVFIAPDAETAAVARPVAEKFLHVISGYTREGTLFPVDVRLRPRGSEGELVQTAESALDYFRDAAEVWEGVTYLKARPVAGDLRLGEEWCESVRERLRERFCDTGRVRAALREMRQRLEDEAAKAGDGDNFKSGPGGFYDLDFILSASALRVGAVSLAGRPCHEQVELFSKDIELSCEERKQLEQAAQFFRGMDHAVRLATGRSTPRLPSGPRAEVVAELASAWLGETLDADALAARLAETRHRLRELFLRFFA